MSELYNIEIEKGFLSCIIQYPDSLAEVSIINEKDFSPINGAIFKIISNEINKGKEVSTILLADKIKGYNIQLEGVDAYDYLEALKLLPAPDLYHFDNGYVGNIRQAQAFIFDKENGLESILYSKPVES